MLVSNINQSLIYVLTENNWNISCTERFQYLLRGCWMCLAEIAKKLCVDFSDPFNPWLNQINAVTFTSLMYTKENIFSYTFW